MIEKESPAGSGPGGAYEDDALDATCIQETVTPEPAKVKLNVDELPPIASIDDVAELVGERGAGLRHLIEHGHNPDLKPAYETRAEAIVAAADRMLEAGCSHGTIIAVLMCPRFKISEAVLERGANARSYASQRLSTAIRRRQDREAREAALNEGADDPVKALAEINADHFISQEGGQFRVYHEDIDPVTERFMLVRSTASDFQLWYMNRYVIVRNGKEMKAVRLGKWWIENPGHRRYDRIAFLPGDGKIPPDTYNLWRGWAVEPLAAPSRKTGGWRELKMHMLKIVCRGVPEYYKYLKRWMAYRVQHPDQQGWSAIVMKGHEGVGKGIVAQNFGRLFGQHFLHVSQSRHLVGNFNMHLRDCCLLFADEAFWAGDKEGEGTLKALITEELIAIEGKHRDVVMARNRLGIMMASNNDWVIPAGPTARRFFVLNVSDEKRGKREYYQPIVDQMRNGGREAMLAELLGMSLEKFNVRKVPPTPELLAQKIKSYSPEEGWWMDKLMRGHLLDDDEGWNQTVPCDQLHDEYIKSVRKAGAAKRSTQTKFGMFLERVLPPGGLGKSRRAWDVKVYDHPNAPEPRIVRRQTYLYELPTLQECRDHFDKRAGVRPGGHGWPRD
jgi:hypothetical protein